jgi:hypothetical protein
MARQRENRSEFSLATPGLVLRSLRMRAHNFKEKAKSFFENDDCENEFEVF